MRITKLTTFVVPPRWLFLKVETDAGVTGWGEPVVEGRAETVAACVAELSDYLDGKLKHPLRQELKRHLKSCQPCQAFLASLKATVEQCRRSPAEGLNRKRTARLQSKVLADYERMIAKSRRR